MNSELRKECNPKVAGGKNNDCDRRQQTSKMLAPVWQEEKNGCLKNREHGKHYSPACYIRMRGQDRRYCERAEGEDKRERDGAEYQR